MKRRKMDRERFENIRAGLIVFGIVTTFLIGLMFMLIYIQPTQTCLEWAHDRDLNAEVCWGYGEDEREFAPANKEITEAKFEEIVTRFYENR